LKIGEWCGWVTRGKENSVEALIAAISEGLSVFCQFVEFSSDFR
jgi:hypothetical protein